MATAASENSLQQDEINQLREHFKDKIRILSSIGQFSYILKIRAEQYDVSLTFQLDASYPAKSPEIIITAPRLAPDQISVVQRLLQSYSETLLNQPMILLIYSRLMKWFDENHIQALNTSSSSSVSAPRSPPTSKSLLASKTDELDNSENIKKSSMKTAEDVISRIEWDDRLDSRSFRVGYVDRFLGLQEKAFDEFDFKVDLSTISDRHSNVLAIPKHRIQYFKYNNEIIWDKETRTDLMFGSTGNPETIDEVIKRHQHLMENNHRLSVSQDDEIDQPPPLPRYLTLTDGAYRPNYYLSVPISNSELLSQCRSYRDGLLSSYSSAFSPRSPSNSDEFHLTFLTFRVEGSTQFDQLITILKRLQEELRYHCSYPERLALHFTGIGTFYDRTLFIKCQQNRRLENLRSLIVERFVEQQDKQRVQGVFLAGNYAEFIPHLTLLKCKRKFSSVCPAEAHREIDFGRQTLDQLQLSPIGKGTGNDQEKISSTFQLDLS